MNTHHNRLNVLTQLTPAQRYALAIYWLRTATNRVSSEINGQPAEHFFTITKDDADAIGIEV